MADFTTDGSVFLSLVVIVTAIAAVAYWLGSRARPAAISEEEETENLRKEIAQKAAEAQTIVSAYGEVLERFARPGAIRVSELPADKEAIKRALLRVGAVRRVRRELTPEFLQSLKMAYVRLADFVDAAEADQSQAFSNAITEFGLSDRGKEALLKAAQKIGATHFDHAAETRRMADSLALSAEFDERWATMQLVQ